MSAYNPVQFNCYNNCLAHEQGHALGPGTKVDMTPSDPTTMITAMVLAQKVTEETEQHTSNCTESR